MTSPPREPPPFDPLRGAFAVLILLVVGLILATGGILAGCFFSITALCEKGGNIKDVTLEIITVLAILLGARKPPPQA